MQIRSTLASLAKWRISSIFGAKDITFDRYNDGTKVNEDPLPFAGGSTLIFMQLAMLWRRV
jgi:hypothetical protein